MEIAYLPALLMVFVETFALGELSTIIEVSFEEVIVFFERVTPLHKFTLMPYLLGFVILFDATVVLSEPS
jgi:hypothetical protein